MAMRHDRRLRPSRREPTKDQRTEYLSGPGTRSRPRQPLSREVEGGRGAEYNQDRAGDRDLQASSPQATPEPRNDHPGVNGEPTAVGPIPRRDHGFERGGWKNDINSFET